jgi:hypothetical protein
MSASADELRERTLHVETKNLLTESGEIRAILSKSHKTARENRRQRKAREKRAKP